jgi:hypothetical protein
MRGASSYAAWHVACCWLQRIRMHSVFAGCSASACMLCWSAAAHPHACCVSWLRCIRMHACVSWLRSASTCTLVLAGCAAHPHARLCWLAAQRIRGHVVFAGCGTSARMLCQLAAQRIRVYVVSGWLRRMPCGCSVIWLWGCYFKPARLGKPTRPGACRSVSRNLLITLCRLELCVMSANMLKHCLFPQALPSGRVHPVRGGVDGIDGRCSCNIQV